MSIDEGESPFKAQPIYSFSGHPLYGRGNLPEGGPDDLFA